MYDTLKPPSFPADPTAEVIMGEAGRPSTAADFPPNMPQTFECQPYVRAVLERVGFTEPGSWARATQAERQAAIANAEVFNDIAAEMEGVTNMIGDQIVLAISGSAHADTAEELVPNTKRVHSLLSKLERRYQKPDLCGSDPAHCGKPVSDVHRFIVIGEPPLQLLHALREYFGVPEIWLDSQATIYEGRNTHNPWSQPDFFGRRAKLYMMIDGQPVLFEVQAYTRREYEEVYVNTKLRYSLAKNGGHIAVSGATELMIETRERE